ncbi:MAG: hypothetical protein ACREEP_15190 [Dongiaceae bacterium]
MTLYFVMPRLGLGIHAFPSAMSIFLATIIAELKTGGWQGQALP